MTNLTNATHEPINNHCPNCGEAVANVAQSADFGAFMPNTSVRYIIVDKETGERKHEPDSSKSERWQIYGLPMEDGRARRWIICKGDGYIHYHTGLMEWKNTASGRFSGKLTGRRVEFLWLQSEHSTDCRELEPSANEGQMALL